MSVIKILEEQPLRRFHFILLALACLVYAATAMNVMLIAVALKPISVEWKLDPTAAGILGSYGYVGMFVGALSSGFIAD